MTTRVVRLASLVAIAIVAWLAMWNSGLPRVRYDTLWYSTFTYEDAGIPREAAWARSWDLLGRLGSPELVASIPKLSNGSWFDGWDDPMRARWVGIYAMRPAMPVLGAGAFPILGTDAPIAVSLLAVILLVLAAWLVLGPMAGAAATAVALLLTFADPLIAKWLIFLMPDGIGLGLWLASLGLAARYVVDGRLRWPVAAGVATLVLALDRPSAVLVPAILAGCGALALLARGPWRRFAVATITTGIAAGLFTGAATVLGLPSFRDFLEDLPTDHFAKPDVPHPVDYMLPYAEDLMRAVPGYLAEHPLMTLLLALGVVGLLVTRRWWTAPFLLALGAVPVLALSHPVVTEVERTLAPIWLSVNLGIGLLVAAVVGALIRRSGRSEGAVGRWWATLGSNQ